MAARIVKLLCVIFSVVTVLLCGCDKNARAAEISADFTARFTGAYRGLALGGEITAARQGACSVCFDAPETLRGLCLRCRGGEISLKRGNVAADVGGSGFPSGGFPSLLSELLAKIAEGDYRAGGGNSFTLSLGGGECVLKTDENGLPKSADVPDAGLSIAFTDCRKLGGSQEG